LAVTFQALAMTIMSGDTISENSVVDSKRVFQLLWHGRKSRLPQQVKNFGICVTNSENIW